MTRAHARIFPVLLALALLSGCDEGPANDTPEPRPVNSIVARSAPGPTLRLAGVVQAQVESELAFRTVGRMISRKVDVGDLVKAGDVLAEIDPLALELSARSAEADVRNAEAQLENATLIEKRKRTLASTNAGSPADLEVAELGLRSAEAKLAQTRASLSKAQEQLGYAQLRAQFDGVVTATSGEVGQTVTAGQTVLKIARLDHRDVVVDVPESQLDGLRPGARFDVALQLDDSLRATGILREIGPQADPETRTYRLKIAIDDAPEVFRLGSVVTVTLVQDGSTGAIRLPSSAILHRDGASHVWVVDRASQSVSLREVQVAGADGGDPRVRVLKGLSDGDEVVVAGVDALTAGQKVRLEQDTRP